MLDAGRSMLDKEGLRFQVQGARRLISFYLRPIIDNNALHPKNAEFRFTRSYFEEHPVSRNQYRGSPNADKRFRRDDIA
jgi:hypothetical protein